MTKTLIASDLDGTLLNSRRIISPASLEAIRYAEAGGAVFTLATGRSIEGLSQYLYIFDRDTPLITYNGAVVIMSHTRRVLFSRLLQADAALSIVRQGIAGGCLAIVWCQGLLYVSQADGRAELYEQVSGVRPTVFDDSLLTELGHRGITKILWEDVPENIEIMREKYLSAPCPGVAACTSVPMLLEFFSDKAGKGRGLLSLADSLGVDSRDTLALGDGENDIDMLKSAGTGAAMLNAPDNVKAAADWITLSNDEDGAAAAIRRFVDQRL